MIFTLFLFAFLTRSDFEVDGFTYHILDSTKNTVQVVQCSKSTEDIIKIPSKVPYESKDYSVISISHTAFSGNNIRQFTTIYFPYTLEDIEAETFYEFTNLTKIGYTDENNKDIDDKLPPLLSIIHPNTFYSTSIKSVTSDSVTTLETGCFSSCSYLVTAQFSSKLEKIGDESFHGCISLTAFDIGEKVTDIGTSAFRACYALQKIDLNNVKTVYNYAFQYCASLISVNLKTVEILAEYVFADLEKLATIELPTTLTELHSYCFMRTPLTTVKGTPEKVTEIKRCFAFCESLVSVPKFENVRVINNESFYYCSKLERFETGEKLAFVGENTFSYCHNLKQFVTASKEFSVAHYAFRQCYVLQGFQFEAVVEMSNNSFESCNAFDVVDLSKSSLTCVPYHAFFRCTALKRVVLPPNMASISSVSPFAECPIEKVEFTGTNGPITIGQSFANFQSITDVVFAESCQVSLDGTFVNCVNLKTITLPTNNVALIGTFCGCSSLEKVDNFNGVVEIDGAFQNCIALSSLGQAPQIMAVGDMTFENCFSLTTLEFTNKLTSVGKSAFKNCYSLTSIGATAAIESIGEFAFSNCQKLASLHFGKLTVINDGSFTNCSSLSDISDLTSVITVGEKSFENCKSLTVIKFTNKLTSVGRSAFKNCIMLNSIGETAGIESIGDMSFSNCVKFTSLHFGSELRTIGDEAFCGCNGLVSVTFSPIEKLTVGFKSFESCESLETVYIEKASTVEISKEAFENCITLSYFNFTIIDHLTIGDYSFYGCPLNDSLSFDSKELKISHHAFSSPLLKTIEFKSEIDKLCLFEDSFTDCSGVDCVIANASLVDDVKVAFNKKVVNGEFCPSTDDSDSGSKDKKKKLIVVVGVVVGVLLLVVVIAIIVVIVRNKRNSDYQAIDDNQNTLFNTVKK